MAASRARDRMYLFHSVTRNDLSTACLRRRILECFRGAKPQEIAGIDRDELERRALQDNRSVVRPPQPFDSWFEVDVALELARKEFIIIPQYEIAGKRIDIVVEGGNAKLAVECDGDKWHGAERYEDDMQRQRQLEHCGWEFFRVRESAFYSNKENVLQGLWQALEKNGVSVRRKRVEEIENAHDDDDVNETEEEINGDDSFTSAHQGSLFDQSSGGNAVHSDGQAGRRVDQVSMSEIQDAILRALSKCQNNSCTIHSITA